MEDAKLKRECVVREAKINLILDAARKVFSESGFHDARLEDIAAVAGFSKASLYSYYEDKESIFLSLAIREYDKVVNALKMATVSDQPFIIKFRTILTTIFDSFGEHFSIFLPTTNHRTVAMLSLNKICEHHEKLTAHFVALYQELSGIMVSLVADGRTRGELKSDLTDAVIAKYINSLIKGIIFDWKITGVIGDTQKEIDTVVDFVLHGVAENDLAARA